MVVIKSVDSVSCRRQAPPWSVERLVSDSGLGRQSSETGRKCEGEWQRASRRTGGRAGGRAGGRVGGQALDLSVRDGTHVSVQSLNKSRQPACVCV